MESHWDLVSRLEIEIIWVTIWFIGVGNLLLKFSMNLQVVQGTQHKSHPECTHCLNRWILCAFVGCANIGDACRHGLKLWIWYSISG